MPSFKFKADPRQRQFLKLIAIVRRELGNAYATENKAGQITQSILANKLNVDKAAIHRRLNVDANMTLRTLADMAWALNHLIDVRIFKAAQPQPLNRPLPTAVLETMDTSTPAPSPKVISVSASTSATRSHVNV